MAYFEQTQLTDENGVVINPAKEQTLYTSNPPNNAAGAVVRTQSGSVDDQITLLRRIVKLMESQAATDTAQRQRIVLDSALPTGSNTIGSVTVPSGVALQSGSNTIGSISSVTNVSAVAGWNQQMFSDPARTAYNTGIRAQLTFTN